MHTCWNIKGIRISRLRTDVIVSSTRWRPHAISVAYRKTAEASPPSDFVVCSSLVFDHTTRYLKDHRRIAPTLPSSCICKKITIHIYQSIFLKYQIMQILFFYD